MFGQFSELECWLNAKGLFNMDFGLERMRSALQKAGLATLPFPVIQVLGTNGKGSTCAFLESLARAHGLKTGLYTSPHFVSFRERIQINGCQISEQAWFEAANALAARLGDDLEKLTYFEFLTVLAAHIFLLEKVDLAIFEAGLGGAHDATTALPAKACLFTPIALDHANIIGPGIAQIARDKAGAIRQGGTVFAARQFPQAAWELGRAATLKNARLRFVQPLGATFAGNLALAGKTQLVNGGLALAVWQWLAAEMGIANIHEVDGLLNAFLPGRMQRLPKTDAHGTIILDGGHNPHAICAVLRQLPVPPQTVIYSALADKDWPTCLAMLGRLAAPILIPQLHNARAANAEEMAAALPHAKAVMGEDSLAKALAEAKGTALICGSLYLLAQFYTIYPQYLQRQEV